MVDNVFEPIMSRYGEQPFLTALFGTGKGSGAAVVMFIVGVAGVLICLIAGRKLKKYHYTDDENVK